MPTAGTRVRPSPRTAGYSPPAGPTPWSGSGTPAGRELGQLRGHPGYIMRMTFSPDGKWLAPAGASYSGGHIETAFRQLAALEEAALEDLRYGVRYSSWSASARRRRGNFWER